MRRAVTRANEKLRELGLSDVFFIVYAAGSARLLYLHRDMQRDRELIELFTEPGPPALACGLLAGRIHLSLVLGRGGSA
jgi:hypothetical protein